MKKREGTKGSNKKGRANVKDVKICVKKKVKKAQKYEHVRRRSKPCDNMENDRQWKRYNQRDDARLLSGWGLET